MGLGNDREIVGIGTLVYPEGDFADLTFHTGTGATRLTVAFAQIVSAASQIHRAALLMVYRQAMTRDGGKTAIETMIHSAIRPKEVTITIDAETGDRIFLMQFTDQPPMLVRMAPEAVNDALADLADVAKRTAN